MTTCQRYCQSSGTNLVRPCMKPAMPKTTRMETNVLDKALSGRRESDFNFRISYRGNSLHR